MKNNKAFVLSIVLIVMSFFTCITNNKRYAAEKIVASAPAADVLSIHSRSACLMEVTTGKILFEKNADEKLKPASVTKIMTLLLIFDAIEQGNLKMDDVVTVSEHAASMGGSQCFFEQGEQQTVEDMIKCIEIASGNDAAVAMAEHLAGSEEAFVIMMNDKAKELGMNNTNFVNACGLEAEGHVTSARDIAIMSQELLSKHPEILNYSTIWMDKIYHVTKKGKQEFDLANTNKFLRQYPGANGLKTGYTSQAGYCMSACAYREGVMLIAVIMGADTKEIRNSEAGKLLDLGFSKCKLYVDEELKNANLCTNITGGTKNTLSCTIAVNSNQFVIDCNASEITKTINYHDKLHAPINKGDIVGEIQYKHKDQILYKVPIYAAETIEKTTYKYCFKTIFSELFLMTTK